MSTPPPPEPDERLSSLIDTTSSFEELAVRSRLGEFKRLAESTNDARLANVVRCEGNVFCIFDERQSYDALASSVPQLLFDSDVDYLRARAAQTPNIRAQARYLHALAAMTKRHDDGRAAAEGYLAAIRVFRNQKRHDNSDALHALHNLFPLAMQMARRYGVFDAFKVEAIEFLLDEDEIFGAVKAEVLKLVVEDTRGFNVDDMRRLRDFSLKLPWMRRGDAQPAITAVAQTGLRLADRLQESRRPWYEAEVRALEGRLDLGMEPIGVEMTGTRLLRLAQLLGDDGLHKRTLELMRAARSQVKYFEFSGQPEGWLEQVEELRRTARKMVTDHGPAAVLRWLATSPRMIPSVGHVRAQAQKLEAGGVGVFRKIATRTSSIGERVIGQSSAPEDADSERVDEMYNISWQFGSVLQLSVFMAELIPSGEIGLEDLERHLRESWMGGEENVPYGGGTKMPNDLVRLLVAGLRLYVALHTEQTHQDSLIPVLDSLTLRVEAVVRKFARVLGVPDSRTVDDGHGQPVTKVAGIELLDHARIAEKCGEDLIAFAKHTLDRRPEGLRDRLSHAILHADQYRTLDLDAVVLLLLRLSGIQIEVNEPDEHAVT